MCVRGLRLHVGIRRAHIGLDRVGPNSKCPHRIVPSVWHRLIPPWGSLVSKGDKKCMVRTCPFASTFTERVKTRVQLQNGRTLHRPLILLHPAAEYGTSTTKTSQISPAYVIVATSTTGLRALNMPSNKHNYSASLAQGDPKNGCSPRPSTQITRPVQKNRTRNPSRVPTDYSHPIRTQTKSATLIRSL